MEIPAWVGQPSWYQGFVLPSWQLIPPPAGVRPDFLSEASWLDDMVRGLVEVPMSKAA